MNELATITTRIPQECPNRQEEGKGRYLSQLYRKKTNLEKTIDVRAGGVCIHRVAFLPDVGYFPRLQSSELELVLYHPFLVREL